MAHIDIFRSDTFSLRTMTEGIRRVDYKPQLLGMLNIFNDVKQVRTTGVSIESIGNTINVIPTTPRGASPVKRRTEKRKAYYFDIPRLAKADTITASEIQDIRAFGTESELMQVQDEVNRRLNGSGGLFVGFILILLMLMYIVFSC